MNSEDKIKVFEEELSLINDTNIAKHVSKILGDVPDVFFTAPASSTGKHHPEKARMIGGLVWHTKVAVRIGYDMINSDTLLGVEEKLFLSDIVVSALILHDTYKYGLDGKSELTLGEHPRIAFNVVRKYSKNPGINLKYRTILEDIAECIYSHMGKWNIPKENPSAILPVPNTKLRLTVHQADMLSSRLHVYWNISVPASENA